MDWRFKTQDSKLKFLGGGGGQGDKKKSSRPWICWWILRHHTKSPDNKEKQIGLPQN